MSKWDGTGTAATPVITSGLDAPAGLAFDSAGDLYISNFGDSTVSKWDGTGTAATPVITSGLDAPAGLAFY